MPAATPADGYFRNVEKTLSNHQEIERKALEARRRQHTNSLMPAGRPSRQWKCV
jgi:hypothetical protein